MLATRVKSSQPPRMTVASVKVVLLVVEPAFMGLSKRKVAPHSAAHEVGGRNEVSARPNGGGGQNPVCTPTEHGYVNPLWKQIHSLSLTKCQCCFSLGQSHKNRSAF